MDELLSALKPHATTRFFKKGATILYQSEIPRSVFIVRKGLIRAYSITSSGEERIAALHSRHDVFPLSWVYGKTPHTLFYYEASSDCEVVCIAKDAFTETISHQPKLLKNILEFAVSEYTAMLIRVTALEQSTAAEKIAMTLYYLMMRHGVEHKPGMFTINFKMTQSMLAHLVGLTRESTTVNLKTLQHKEVVSYKNFTYTIDKARLERFVGEDSFTGVSLH